MMQMKVILQITSDLNSRSYNLQNRSKSDSPNHERFSRHYGQRERPHTKEYTWWLLGRVIFSANSRFLRTRAFFASGAAAPREKRVDPNDAWANAIRPYMELTWWFVEKRVDPNARGRLHHSFRSGAQNSRRAPLQEMVFTV